ncbi:glycine zipper 2TM domain-containing protein [Tsuneonella sp. HG249]
MKTHMFKSAALALAIPGLAFAAPVAAAPTSHSAAYDNGAVWSGAKAEHGRKHRRDYQRYNDERYYNNYGSNQAYYGDPVHANTRVWQGDDGRYYCRRSNGTTGLVIGAAGGALLGREIAGRYGDRTLGAILGAAGGALLGRSIDRSSTRCR